MSLHPGSVHKLILVICLDMRPILCSGKVHAGYFTIQAACPNILNNCLGKVICELARGRDNQTLTASA